MSDSFLKLLSPLDGKKVDSENYLSNSTIPNALHKTCMQHWKQNGTASKFVNDVKFTTRW